LKLKQATFLLTKEIVALNDETKDQTDKIGTISTETLVQTSKIREINEDTRKQGKTITFFTIITIIFVSCFQAAGQNDQLVPTKHCLRH
jgi:hypothetical protein